MGVVNNMITQENITGFGVGSENNVKFGGYVAPNQVHDQQSSTGESESVFSCMRESNKKEPSSKKRKLDSGVLDVLVELLRKMHDATDSRLQCLASRIGYEFDLTKARKEVFALVGVVPGLSIRQQFAVCGYIFAKVERHDFFIGLPEVSKTKYVLMVLEEVSPP